MKKLEGRPEKLKVKKYLNYERLNLKSHIYNDSIKGQKMFNQLNAQDQPALPQKDDQTTFGTEPDKRQQSLTLTMYEPKLV